MLTKNLFIFGVATIALGAFAATPTITGVTAQQRYPWNGKVDISYTVTGDIAAEAKQSAVFTSLKVTAIDKVANTTNIATQLSGDTALTAGTHKFVWDMNAEGLTFKSSNVVFNVSCETTPATYCVIDLSAGANATSYPVTYLAEPPSGGFNIDAYKTTKLVLRRLEAGTFIMGEDQDDESHRVTLTKPFFCGLFEVTQKQYALVTGSNPSDFSGDTLPVEKVNYNEIRGSSDGAKWPSSSAVDSSSFLGKLRSRTGLGFDLPTEAQWEYACRAGTTTTYSYGNSENGSYMWYSVNSNSKTHPVGAKSANSWGLYDMHGNVYERCLDWYGALIYGNDPKGSSSGLKRVNRGGSWGYDADSCDSSFRNNCDPLGKYSDLGFRIVRTIYQPAVTVTFDANGGDGVMAAQSLVPGRDSLSPCTFTRTDYAFNGWATNVNDEAVYQDLENAELNGDVTLYAVWTPATYCVIDLSGGANATSYPVTYLASPPSGGFNVDAYKTSKLVLKRIEAGTFIMGEDQNDETHRVTLTKPFFCGLFEVTQKQYTLIMGSNPSGFSGDTLPVEKVSYNMIRGSSNGANWPLSSAVDSSSFMGKLRFRTGLDFDLPTEAQWEYACRAGTTTAYYWGSTMNGNYAWYNDSAISKTNPVGTKMMNAWGLYDMIGNVWEWCIDWYGTLAYGADPKGNSSGTNRVIRGGCWGSYADNCTSSSRTGYAPSNEINNHGFRLVITLSK